MTRVYVAGPMTGRPDFNRAAFEAARVFLEAPGDEVIDPVSQDILTYGSWEEAIKRPWREHLARDLAIVPTCDEIVLLPGWNVSSGARLELRVALTFGLQISELRREAGDLRYRWSFSPADAAVALGDADAVHGFAPPALEATERSREATDASMVDPGFVGSPDAIHDARSTTANGTRLIADANCDGSCGPEHYSGAHGFPSPYDDTGRFVPFTEDPSRHVFGTGGIKDNRGKPPIDLLPSRPLVAIAEILAFGAVKYQPHNWRKGLPWPDTYSSLQRHLLAWNDGEDLDPETGESHLAHAGCQLLFLLDYVITGVGAETDTRWKVEA